MKPTNLCLLCCQLIVTSTYCLCHIVCMFEFVFETLAFNSPRDILLWNSWHVGIYMIVWLQKGLNIGEVHETGQVISINSSCRTSSNIIGMKLELEIKRSQQHCVVTYDSKKSPIYLLSAEIQASNLQCNNNYCTNQQTCQI